MGPDEVTQGLNEWALTSLRGTSASEDELEVRILSVTRESGWRTRLNKPDEPPTHLTGEDALEERGG